MYNYEIKPSLKKVLKKTLNKDRKRYETILKKIQEIISCENINHYKNLRKPMNKFKRIHINNSFVLIFKYNKNTNTVSFCDLDHHDKIYK